MWGGSIIWEHYTVYEGECKELRQNLTAGIQLGQVLVIIYQTLTVHVPNIEVLGISVIVIMV